MLTNDDRGVQGLDHHVPTTHVLVGQCCTSLRLGACIKARPFPANPAQYRPYLAGNQGEYRSVNISVDGIVWPI